MSVDPVTRKPVFAMRPTGEGEGERPGRLRRMLDGEGRFAMMTLDRLEERFRNDAQFRALVDVLTGMILKLEIGPSELREAAMFANFRAEMMAPRPMMVELGRDEARIIDDYRRWGGK